MTKLISCKKLTRKPSCRTDNSMKDDAARYVKDNHLISKSIWKRIKFCDRSGTALQGHRDDDGISNTIKENLKATRNLRALLYTLYRC